MTGQEIAAIITAIGDRDRKDSEAKAVDALEQIVEWDREDGHDGTHPFACSACQRIDLAQKVLAAAHQGEGT